MRNDIERLKQKTEDIKVILDVSFKAILDTQDALMHETANMHKLRQQLEYLGEAIQQVDSGIVVLEHMLDLGKCEDIDNV